MTDPSQPDSRSSNGMDEEYVESLERYRRRLDGAMLAGDLAWWEMDVETGATAFHENKVQMLGLSPADFDHYEDFTERLHPDDYERAMQAMRDHLEGDAEKYEVEYRIRDADGEYRWFHDVGGITEWTDDGRPEKVTGIVVDVTERKRVERRLQRKNEQLALLNRIVRHDIRNDMSVITGWVDVLEDELPSEQGAELDRIRSASEHTIELTTDVRDLMAILESDEEEELDLHPVDLQRTVLDEVERVRRSFDDVEITAEDLPAARVEGNGMLSSVVGNLLNNAVQHNDEEVARIDVAIEGRDDTVVLRIADNGPGIPPARREELLQKGSKGLDSEGTGLGLFLVDTLVEAFGGSISIADNEPKGTVFTVELVRADD
ncbi:MAG: ATP-binding protein [Haloferacaceae archaeon]